MNHRCERLTRCACVDGYFTDHIGRLNLLVWFYFFTHTRKKKGCDRMGHNDNVLMDILNRKENQNNYNPGGIDNEKYCWSHRKGNC